MNNRKTSKVAGDLKDRSVTHDFTPEYLKYMGEVTGDADCLDMCNSVAEQIEQTYNAVAEARIVQGGFTTVYQVYAIAGRGADQDEIRRGIADAMHQEIRG